MTFERGAKHHPIRARTTGNTDDCVNLWASIRRTAVCGANGTPLKQAQATEAFARIVREVFLRRVVGNDRALRRKSLGKEPHNMG